MKTRNNLLTLIGLTIILTQMLSSCGITDKVVRSNVIQKRKYNKGSYVNTFVKALKTKIEKSNFNPSNNQGQKNYEPKIAEQVVNQNKVGSLDNLTASSDNEVITLTANNPVLLQNELNTTKQEKIIKQVEECDEIILRNGEIVSAKVTEVGVNEIKYKKCGNLSGPTYSVLKSEVFLIKYASGEKDVFKAKSNESSNTSNVNTSDAELEPFASFSFISGIFGLAIGLFLSGLVGILFGVLGIIFGGIGLGRISEYPDKYKGKGLAIAGLLTGIIVTALVITLTILLITLI